MARRRHNPGSGASGYVMLAGVGIAAYFAYEWLKTNCASGAPQFPSLCAIFPVPNAVAVTSTAAAASSTLTANQQALQLFGIPTDAQPVAHTPGSGSLIGGGIGGCNQAAPITTGQGYTAGVSVEAAPFVSPSTGQAYCGPADVWQRMGGSSLPTPQPVPTTPPAATTPPAVTGGSNLYGPPTSTAWQLAIATMKAAAGTNSLNYNQWFWYFQNTPAPVGAPSGFGVPGSVTPQVAALTAQIGGDPTGASNISAEQFATAFATARSQSGISGFGFNREPGIPASWLTTYGFDGDAYL